MDVNKAADAVLQMAGVTEEQKAAQDKSKEDVVVDTPDITFDQAKSFFEKDEESFYSLISEKTSREVKSIDDLFQVEEKVVEKIVEKDPELPEQVKKFWEFNIGTNGGVEEWMKANKDWDSESKDVVVKEYIKRKEKFEGENLNTFLEINYKVKDEFKDKSVAELEEAGYSYEEIERAKSKMITYDRDYRLGLDYLKQEQEKYKIPSNEYESKRQAAEEETERKLKFSQAATAAINGLKEISIGDELKYVPDFTATKDKYQSIDGILSLFNDSDGNLDVSSLIATVEKGLNAEKIADIKAKKAVAKYIEDEGGELANSRVTETQRQASGGQNKQQSFDDVHSIIFKNS